MVNVTKHFDQCVSVAYGKLGINYYHSVMSTRIGPTRTRTWTKSSRRPRIETTTDLQGPVHGKDLHAKDKNGDETLTYNLKGLIQHKVKN